MLKALMSKFKPILLYLFIGSTKKEEIPYQKSYLELKKMDVS